MLFALLKHLPNHSLLSSQLAELIEFVHLLLFFAFIVYYAFVSLVGFVCVRHLNKLRAFEESLGNEMYSRAKEVALLQKVKRL